MDCDYDRDMYHIDDAEAEADAEAEEEIGLGRRAEGQELVPAGHTAEARALMRKAKLRYDPKFNPIAMRLCEAGYTDAELAETFGVHIATLYRWMAEFPDFKEACKLGKESVDDRVVASLYKRAVGYERRTEKIGFNEGNVIRAETIEHVPGDVKAQSLWLRNRRRDEWRESTELTGAGGKPLIPTDPTSIKEAARYYAFILARANAITVEEDEGHGPLAD